VPGASWGPDSAADEAVVASNVASLLTHLVQQAPARTRPAVTLAYGWHRDLHQGVGSVLAAHYLGGVRGGGHPDLAGYEVVLGNGRGGLVAGGVPAAQVPAQLKRFERSLRTAVRTLDGVMAAGQRPADNTELLAVVELAAVVHGEWVRIHPYANGNGRTARTWANWVALRYGLPPFIRIKPRPDALLYAQAAHRSMGLPPVQVPDHSLTTQVFLDLLRTRP
jgi:hypothetical protein